MKKQSCRMTQQEKETHKKAGKYRRMTDAQLVDMVESLERRAEKAEENARVLQLNMEGAQKAMEAAKTALSALEKQQTDNLPTEEDKSRISSPERVVAGLLDVLEGQAGKGKGIGMGTVAKVRRLAAEMPQETIERIFFGKPEKTAFPFELNGGAANGVG